MKGFNYTASKQAQCKQHNQIPSEYYKMPLAKIPNIKNWNSDQKYQLTN